MRRRHLVLLIPLLLASFWLAVSSLTNDSPSMDEQNHIARGLALLRTGDPRLSLEHPPLTNSWSALPVLTVTDVQLPTDDASWGQTDGWYRFASLLFWEYNPDKVAQIVLLARIPIVSILMLMATVGYRFASAIWHPRAGLLAACCLLFDPNILAHARYSTTDIGGAATLMLALFMLWRLWRPSASVVLGANLLGAALALGMAFASKLSNLGFVPVFAILAMLPLFGQRWHLSTALRRLGLYLVAGVLSIGVVWATFWFEWGALQFEDARLAMLNGVMGPMPTYWAGIERIALTTNTGRAAYLLGDFSDSGFPLYFPVAFLVKTPLIALLLIVSGLLFTLNFRTTRSKAFFLLIPALFYFGTTTRSGLNIGYRHLMPMLVLLYVMAAGLMPKALRRESRLTFRGFLVLVCAGGLIGSALLTHPHYLQHFNATVGAERGWQVLGDSNIDWGQDLLRLQQWMSANEIERVKLSYFGTADPSVYVAHDPLPSDPVYYRNLWWAIPFDRAQPEPGIYAISVHNLLEMPLRVEEKTVFEYFRQLEPDERVGSFNIYRVR